MTSKLQNKFAAGDKVVRTCEYTAVSDGGFMKKGEEYRVETVLNDREIRVEGSSIDYSSSYFKLVQPAFRNMKFRVNSPEQSKEIQEALFEMGYKWATRQAEDLVLQGGDFITTYEDGVICYGLGQRHFEIHNNQEYEVETTKSYKLIPVEPIKETVTIDGKTYDKEAVLKRLAELETVQN